MLNESIEFKPDFDLANKVEESLEILHRADSRYQQADQYLNSVRASPKAWSACYAILLRQDVSGVLLVFSAKTLYDKIKENWRNLSDVQHANVFEMVLEGLSKMCRADDLNLAKSAAYSLGKACGFVMHMAQSYDNQAAIWDLVDTKISSHFVLKCTVLEGIGTEISEMEGVDELRKAATRFFGRQKSKEVLRFAAPILTSETNDSSNLHTSEIRSSVQCLQSWDSFADKTIMVQILSRAIRRPDVAESVSDTLSEAVSYSQTDLKVLMETCKGLISSFEASRGLPNETIVQHAIAEVVSGLSDGNADDIMGCEEGEPSISLTREVIKLLWLCLHSTSTEAFFAAVDGWTCWLTAVAAGTPCHGLTDHVPSLISTVLARIRKGNFILEQCDQTGVDPFDSKDSRVRVRELLTQCFEVVQVQEYFQAVTHVRDQEKPPSSEGLCVFYFAASVAGSCIDDEHLDQGEKDTVNKVLQHALHVLLSSGSGLNGSFVRAAARREAVSALTTFGAFIGEHASNSDFREALKSAGKFLMDKELREEAAKYLIELVDRSPGRIGRQAEEFFPLLLQSVNTASPHMTYEGAKLCTHALAQMAESLKSPEKKREAITALLAGPIEVVQSLNTKQPASHGGKLSPVLNIITAVLQEIDALEVALSVMNKLFSKLSTLALSNSGDEKVATSIHRFCSTFMRSNYRGSSGEDGGASPEEEEMELRRVIVACSLITLGAKCFAGSGGYGEPVWLDLICELCNPIDTCAYGSNEKVIGPFSRALDESVRICHAGLQSFTSGGLQTQPKMTISYLSLATTWLRRDQTGSSGEQNMDACSKVAFSALRTGNIKLILAGLSWWRFVFNEYEEANSPRTSAALSAIGGADELVQEIVYGARFRKCATSAGCVLYSICKWLAMRRSVSFQSVIRSYLELALKGKHMAHVEIESRNWAFTTCLSGIDDQYRFETAFARAAAAWTEEKF